MGVRRVIRASIAPVLGVVLLAGASARVALADGDPASDYLVSNQVFLSSISGAASPAQRELLAVVRAANRAGFPIRVAVVSSQYDLGSITVLWRKPDLYARFLGQELESVYRQRLLVVMPDGFGFNWPGHSASPSYRLLANVPTSAPGGELAIAAQAAVRRLAAAAGVRLVAASSSTTTRGSDLAAIVGGIIGALVVLAAVGFLVPRARRRLAARRRAPRPVAAGRGLPAGMRWAIPGAAVLCAAAVAAPILAFSRSHGSDGGVSSAQAASVVTAPPFTWPAGRRPAPDFVLRDQSGRPVSVAAYRGRPVIVTFIDPLCRNLCPLEAQVLNQTIQQLPAAQRPVILAVSVDIYSHANSPANLDQTFREWHLVPQWNWAVGSPAQLAAVWKRYLIGVSVVTKRIAGTTIHYITHTEAAYVVDPSGHERALFVWPFYPQDVKRVLHQLA
jgi:protein SCO1